MSALQAKILELKLKLEVYADVGADVRDKAEVKQRVVTILLFASVFANS